MSAVPLFYNPSLSVASMAYVDYVYENVSFWAFWPTILGPFCT